MKPSLWIINSALVAIFALCLCVMLLLQPKTPPAASLLPKAALNQADNIAPVNLKNIYEDDIFKTHITSSQTTNILDANIAIPTPPNYQEPQIDPVNVPVFLEPLPITMTGIITFSNEEYNRAMIRDQRDQIERSYQVGDDLEDAQIIRILPNKVIIIRANSQQETLFLREQDIIADLDSIEPDWKNLITNTATNCYLINTREFVHYVKNLGNFIDLLNLVTAYKAGASTGVKIGNNTVSPIVAQLGLQSGDIITTINDLSIADISGRIQVYNLIIDPKTTLIFVKVLRNKTELTLEYTLNQGSDVVINNAIDVAAHVAKNQANFEIINDKIKTQDRNHIAQFKNKISQSVSR